MYKRQILDFEKLEKHISKADLIYHLAGVTDVGTTKKDINNQRDNLVRNVGIKGTQNIIKLSQDKAKIILSMKANRKCKMHIKTLLFKKNLIICFY